MVQKYLRNMALVGVILIPLLMACTKKTDPMPVARLADSSWALVSFEQLGGNGEETPVLAETSLTLQFQTPDQVGGQGGCNQFGGKFQADGDRLSIQELNTTEMACEEGIMVQEQRYYEALQAVETFEITEDRLRIWYDGGQAVLNLVPLSAQENQTNAAKIVRR